MPADPIQNTTGWWDRPIAITPRLIACLLVGGMIGNMLWKAFERFVL